MKRGQAEKKIENENIIRQMLDEGATIEEIAAATDYSEYTVLCKVRVIRSEIVKEENLTLAEHPKPEMPIVEVNGKKYRDITDTFLSSEWEEIE